MPDYAGMASIDYTGARYVLGRTADSYAIWEAATGGQPQQVFPATPEGWTAAWLRFRELEGGAVPVPAGAPVPDGTIRPFGLAGVFAGTFRVWGRSFLAFCIVVASVMIPFALLQVLVIQAVVGPELEPLFSGLVPPAEFQSFLEAIEESIPSFIAAVVGLAVASLFVQALMTGALTHGGLRGFTGARVAAGEMLSGGLRRTLSLAWILFLTFLLVFVVGAPAIFVIVLLAAATGSGALTALLIILATLGLLLFASRYLLAPSVLFAEDVRGAAALRRSWRLTRGRAWAVFGTYLLFVLIAAVAGAILGIPFQLIASGQDTVGSAWMITALGSSFTAIFTTPFLTLALVHMYIDNRARKEALDPAALDPDTGAPAL